MMVGNFIVTLNKILNEFNPYVTNNNIEASLNREFDKDSLLVKMKYWFVSQYMHRNIFNCDNPKEYDPELLDNYYKDAKRCANYLFKNAELFIGTNKEINQLAKKRFGEGQKDPNNIDKYWCNGEVFILRIVDNKVTYTIR